MCIYIYIYIYIAYTYSQYMCVCVYIYIYRLCCMCVCIHVCIYIYICMYVYVHIYIYIYIYIYIHITSRGWASRRAFRGSFAQTPVFFRGKARRQPREPRRPATRTHGWSKHGSSRIHSVLRVLC